MTDPLGRVAAALRDEGGLLADAVIDGGEDGAWLGRLAAAGPRSAGREEDVAFVVESVHEGWRQHAARDDAPPRVLETPDEDLALLAGDRLYALGLARLAELSDAESVDVLARVIGLAARASVDGDPDLADAAWMAGAVAVGWGVEGALADAFAGASAGAPGGAVTLRTVARQIAGEMALSRAHHTPRTDDNPYS